MLAALSSDKLETKGKFYSFILLLFFEEGRFTSKLNAAKNTDYIKKCFKQNLFGIKFPTKNLTGIYLLSPPGVELGDYKDCLF